jgi:hypothetical protein
VIVKWPTPWRLDNGGDMLVELDYKGYRIVANAVATGERWDCDVILRRRFSPDLPHRELVTCSKVTPKFAEQAGARWARFWIDRRTAESQHRAAPDAESPSAAYHFGPV